MARQSKAEMNSEQAKIDRRAYLSRPHIPKKPVKAEPEASAGGAGYEKKTTVTTGKKKTATQKSY